MSAIQIRVLVEVADSGDQDDVVIRSEQVETVIPATADTTPEDHGELLIAMFDRMSEQARKTVNEQVRQLGQFVMGMME